LTISKNRAKARFWAAFFCAFATLASSELAQASPLGWQPDGNRIWVFVVGLVKFENKDVFDDFPVKNRRDPVLVQLFKSRGVPADHVTYLQDRQAKLSAIQPALIKLLRRTAPGDTLFLYYEGHGYRTDGKDGFFAAYDTDNDQTPGWSIASICPTIDKYFKGNRAFLTADCCDSGYLAQKVRFHKGPIQYACVTSSSAHEVSTEHWTFTDCLLDALRGESFVDLNGDGFITVREFGAHARTEMALAEEQHAAFARTAGFSPATMICKARPKPKSPLGQRVKVKYGDDWLAGRIVATRKGELQVKCIGYDDPADWFDTTDATQLRWVKSPQLYAVGSKVEVQWQGDWYEARVLKVEGGVHFIHYVEDDSSWDEWVPSSRIRKPRS
jgi:hypothetical protein